MLKVLKDGELGTASITQSKELGLGERNVPDRQGRRFGCASRRQKKPLKRRKYPHFSNVATALPSFFSLPSLTLLAAVLQNQKNPICITVFLVGS